MKHRTLALSSVALVASLSAHCAVQPDDANSSGASESEIRGGGRRRDAGTSTTDAGTTTDTGAPTDSGTATPDAGSDPADSGSATDAGSTTVPGAPRTVTSATPVTAARVSITYGGDADRTDGYRAKWFWFVDSHGSGSGVSCGAWRGDSSIVWEGFRPGETYFTYIEYDNAEHSAGVGFTMPAMPADTTAPAMRNLIFNPYFGGGYITVEAFDNVGLDHIDFFANGASTALGTFSNRYYRPVSSDGYQLDYVMPPADLHGSVSIRAHAIDLAGNGIDTTAIVALP